MSTKDIGNSGEIRAAKFLEGLGYRIIDRNWHCRFGEIDLVALKGDAVVFVEVKTRANRVFGLPEEAVTQRKLRHIRKTIDFYVAQHPGLPEQQLIEVVSIEGDEVRLIEVI